MKNIKLYILLFISILFINKNYAQNVSLNGYVSNMQSVMFDSIKSTWINDNLIHNRLKFNWYASNSISFKLDMRNRIMTGETVKYTPNYGQQLSHDIGWMDLSYNIVDEQSVIINSTIDRLYFSYDNNNLNITVGRQRINWGKTFAWNPNDIFNTYSFFDFDYPEKAGSDAVRIQYYTGMASALELVAKMNFYSKLSFAGLYRFNAAGFDWQMLGGMIDEQDYVGGLGFSGDFKGLNIRSEASYVHPKANFADTSGVLIATIGFDYTFENSLMLQTEFLYNQKPQSQQLASFLQIYDAPMSIKNLSFTEYNIFAQVSYPITPLINTTVSGMYFPDLNGFFAGPSVSISMGDNLEFSTFVQTFSGEFDVTGTGNKERIWFNMGFLRMKFSF